MLAAPSSEANDDGDGDEAPAPKGKKAAPGRRLVFKTAYNTTRNQDQNSFPVCPCPLLVHPARWIGVGGVLS